MFIALGLLHSSGAALGEEPGPPTLLSGPSGVRVVLTPVPSSAITSAALLIPVGGLHEPAGLAGGAHLLEHLVFERRQEPDGPTLAAELDARGCRHGAWTWPAYTTYEFVCPAAARGVQELLLRTLTGLRHDPLEGVTEQAAAVERGIVAAELNREHGGHRRRLARAITETMHRRTHPMVDWARARPGHVDGLELEALRSWGQEAYGHAASVVSLTGAWEVEPTVTSLEERFGALGRAVHDAPPPQQQPPPTVLQLAPDVLESPTGLPRLFVGWQLPTDTSGLEGELLAAATGLALERRTGATPGLLGLHCYARRSGLDVLVQCELPMEPDAPADLVPMLQTLVQRVLAEGPRRQLKSLLDALRGPVGPAAELALELDRAGGRSRALELAVAVHERGSTSLGEALISGDRKTRSVELEAIASEWLAASRARYLLVRPGDVDPGERPALPSIERPVERLATGLWQPTGTGLEVATRRLQERLQVVAVQRPGAVASVSLRYPLGRVSPELVDFLEYFVPPKRRVAEHRGVVGGRSISDDAIVYRAWARADELGQAMTALVAQVVDRKPRDRSVERWLGRRAAVARASLANPASLTGALLAGYVPEAGADPIDAVLGQLDRYRAGSEDVLIVELLALYDARGAEVLVVGPQPPEELLDEAERRLAKLAAFGLPFDLVPPPPEAAAEAEGPAATRWLVHDPARPMARLRSSCPLQVPQGGSLLLEVTAELVARRLFRRLRLTGGLAYAPDARIDGDGQLHLAVVVPIEAAPEALAQLEAAVTAAAEPWETDEARLRVAARMSPELHGPATLPGVLLTHAAGLLATEQIEAIVPTLRAVGPADLDAALAGCAGSTITVALGPTERLALEGFVVAEH